LVKGGVNTQPAKSACGALAMPPLFSRSLTSLHFRLDLLAGPLFVLSIFFDVLLDDLGQMCRTQQFAPAKVKPLRSSHMPEGEQSNLKTRRQ
jgi:hypothetical protein